MNQPENVKVQRYCPKCGKIMWLKKQKETGQLFVGCSQWPDCTYTEPLPEDQYLKAIRAPKLPGF